MLHDLLDSLSLAQSMDMPGRAAGGVLALCAVALVLVLVGIAGHALRGCTALLRAGWRRVRG